MTMAKKKPSKKDPFEDCVDPIWVVVDECLDQYSRDQYFVRTGRDMPAEQSYRRIAAPAERLSVEHRQALVRLGGRVADDVISLGCVTVRAATLPPAPGTEDWILAYIAARIRDMVVDLNSREEAAKNAPFIPPGTTYATGEGA